jgi:hypothetical protein
VPSNSSRVHVQKFKQSSKGRVLSPGTTCLHNVGERQKHSNNDILEQKII